MSSASDSSLTDHHQTSYANTSDGPITEAQQIAQQYGQETTENDPDLTRVIEAWPSLPAALHAAVLAMIDAADTTAAE